jgi:hypothetical protein
MSFVSRGHTPGAGDPFGPGGPFSLADPDRNLELLEAAGFTNVDGHDLPRRRRRKPTPTCRIRTKSSRRTTQQRM